jgi:gamma-glutamyl hercynylcysteine S-oxide hydrolase
MCRHLAVVGTAGLHEPLFGAVHSLADQAERPRCQTSGTTNPDGWGVAWYEPNRAAPAQYRTVTPMWEDHAFAKRAEHIECTAFVAAARLASPGAAIAESGNAPFVDGHWAFSLNGIVDGFREGAGEELGRRLSPERRDALRGDADTEVLFALVLDRIDAGMAPEDALASTVDDVTAITTGRLNLLLTDGRVLYGTRCGNSLYRLGSALASEPIDDQPGWSEVPDDSLVVIDAHTAGCRSLRRTDHR